MSLPLPAVLAAFAGSSAQIDDPSAEQLADGPAPRRVALHMGADVPRELLLAAGFTPRRVPADPDAATPLVDGLVPRAGLPWDARALLEAVLGGTATGDVLVIGHQRAVLPQVFGMLREITRTTDLRVPPTAFVDVLHTTGAPARAYVRRRVRELEGWLAAHDGVSGQTALTAGSLTAASAVLEEQRRLIGRIDALRRGDRPVVDGIAVDAIRRAAWVLHPTRHVAALSAHLDRLATAPGDLLEGGRPVVLAGSSPPTPAVHAVLAAAGGRVIADLHPDADAWQTPRGDGATGLDAIADRHHRMAPPSPAERAGQVLAHVDAGDAAVVVHLCIAGDDRAPWERAPLRAALATRGATLIELDLHPGSADAGRAADVLADTLAAPERAAVVQVRGDVSTRRTQSPAKDSGSRQAARRPSRPADGSRSRKALAAVADFGAHQRAWFAEVRERAADGEPFAVVNADAPQEILRAMDIPYVVNQWWASIVGAKQQTGRYQQRLRHHGLPDRVEPYSTMGLAAALPEDPDEQCDDPDPWGGLPTPTLLGATMSSDATPGLLAAWTQRTGATPLPISRSTDARWDLPLRWWEDLPDRWDEVLEPVRLDLLTAELREQIAVLERVTGRRFDEDRFAEVMHLVNEQEGAYRRTRDLIARTHPAPVGVVDTMPATMVPQWHRGTTWGRDAALALHDEIAARIDEGRTASREERVRLLWVGRGLWSDMGFYQRFEDSHGAVFVWSMYLGLAADGYLRSFDRGRDPLRALAARFATMGDELRMPTWAGAWHVAEARRHGAHGAVAIADADPFVLRALEAAGIPVLRLPIDNTDRASDVDVDGLVAAFLERLAEGH